MSAHPFVFWRSASSGHGSPGVKQAVPVDSKSGLAVEFQRTEETRLSYPLDVCPRFNINGTNCRRVRSRDPGGRLGEAEAVRRSLTVDTVIETDKYYSFTLREESSDMDFDRSRVHAGMQRVLLSMQYDR